MVEIFLLSVPVPFILAFYFFKESGERKRLQAELDELNGVRVVLRLNGRVVVCAPVRELIEREKFVGRSGKEILLSNEVRPW